ncbi:MAG: hypothetical protein WCE52_09820 [Candidatus Acidiferrum sp.]
MFDWITLFLLFLLVGWWCFVQVRHLLRRYSSGGWPTANALVQKGAVGTISFGRGATSPAAFLGYSFFVQGARYAGIFAVYGAEDLVRTIQSGLAGASIDVRFSPSDPNVSYLVDLHDVRFGGLSATQNPEWLDQAPAFSIGDALQK